MNTPKIQKNRFIQADFPENICSIDIFCYKEQIKVAFTIGTSNQKQVLLGYQLLIVVSLNHYNLLDYDDTIKPPYQSPLKDYFDTVAILTQRA